MDARNQSACSTRSVQPPERVPVGTHGQLSLTRRTVIRSLNSSVTTGSPSTISGTFNSLFRVLCIFPSWYLFAIGIRAIFRLSRGLPADLYYTPKQYDSQMQLLMPNTLAPLQGCHLLRRSFPANLENDWTPTLILRAQLSRGANLADSPWSDSYSLAVTREITVVFFSSAE